MALGLHSSVQFASCQDREKPHGSKNVCKVAEEATLHLAMIW